MTLFVLPQFEEIFSSFGSGLPKLTLAVFGINQFILDNLVAILVGIGIALAAYSLFKRTTRGRLTVDGWKLKLPFFGSLIRKVAVARFCRNLAIMLRGGVPVAGAMEITAGVCGNMMLERSLLATRERVIAGANISAALEREGDFPALLIRMVNVGESSGRLPEVLDKVADTFEGQVEGSIMTATALFEPIIICVFGFVILVLVLAIYWPVFTAASGMRGA
jgi:type IV pilus assembly protein PilC